MGDDLRVLTIVVAEPEEVVDALRRAREENEASGGAAGAEARRAAKSAAQTALPLSLASRGGFISFDTSFPRSSPSTIPNLTTCGTFLGTGGFCGDEQDAQRMRDKSSAFAARCRRSRQFPVRTGVVDAMDVILVRSHAERALLRLLLAAKLADVNAPASGRHARARILTDGEGSLDEICVRTRSQLHMTRPVSINTTPLCQPRALRRPCALHPIAPEHIITYFSRRPSSVEETGGVRCQFSSPTTTN